ncbi:MAG TPA: hypothetical protein VK454_07765 [Myxococcaceae bacterium]|nr:hypothetical protein [Myxococcaceae bacterium]
MARTATPTLAVALLLLVGCSHEHGPLSDKPDTTSLGVAGNLGEGDVSTAYGLAAESPNLRGVDTDRANRFTTTAVRPAPLIPGTPGDPETPRTSNDLITWTSGPTLPVEAANRALEPEGEAKPAGHGEAPTHSR